MKVILKAIVYREVEVDSVAVGCDHKLQAAIQEFEEELEDLGFSDTIVDWSPTTDEEEDDE